MAATYYVELLKIYFTRSLGIISIIIINKKIIHGHLWCSSVIYHNSTLLLKSCFFFVIGFFLVSKEKHRILILQKSFMPLKFFLGLCNRILPDLHK